MDTFTDESIGALIEVTSRALLCMMCVLTTVSFNLQTVRQFSLHIALLDAQLRWQGCWRVLLQLQLLHAPKTLTTDCLIDLLNLSSDAL